ncbi:sen15 protein domain-containing protein [Phthorimaea operculella]|nr:sen15 protein domain-containing protein [Phthorimaea operculella]
MDIEEKIKGDMLSLGCKSDLKVSLAYHLYIHLVDEKLMYDTEYCYNKDIDTLYIVARPGKNDKMNIYVPVPTSEDISMERIKLLQENLCTIETGPIINLAFMEGDSTTVIYSFTKGLAEKKVGDKSAQNRMERRSYINSELKKNKSTILNDALNGGVVDEDVCLILD